MLNDYEKIQILIKRNFFISDYDKPTKIAEDVAQQVVNKIINDFTSELSSLDINIDFYEYGASGTGAENWNAYLQNLNTQIKPYEKRLNLKKLKLTSLYKDYFGTKGKNIFSYMNQITTKSSTEHTKLITLDSLFHAKCREKISFLTGVSIDVLKLKDENLFQQHLDAMIEEKNLFEKQEKVFTENKVFISKEFELFRLKYLLELNNEIHHKIGLQQLLKFPGLTPCFFKEDIIHDNILLKHIFIEGYHGTGKTTLAQQIAVAVSLENSFYINLTELKNDILTEEEENKIKRFLESIKYLNGTVILDNINSSAYAKLFTRVCLKIADKINLKMIFISTLEQHNTIQNLQTFTELFHENWDEIKRHNLYIEISLSKTAKKHRLNILDNMVSNYSSIISKRKKFQFTSAALEYLDNEFNGMLYLIKLALDNQNVATLEELKVKKAKEFIITQYKPLLENGNLELIYLSAHDIYFRIQEDLYYEEYLLNHEEIDELFKQKHIYVVKDDSFNKNIVIFFPNQLIPLQLAEYLDRINNTSFNIFTSKESIAKLNTFSKNNIMNMLRYLILRREKKYLYEIIQFVLYPDGYIVNSEQKINLYELNLLVATLTKRDYTYLKTLSLSRQQLILLRELKNSLFVNGSDEYMIFLMFSTHLNIVKDWIIMLSRVINNYKKFKPTNRNVKYIQNQYIEVLVYFLRRTLKIITYPKYSKKISLSRTFLISIIEIMERYSLETIFTSEYEKIYRLSQKIDIST